MTQELKQIIGTRVRLARERKNMTQEELAAQIKKSVESVSNIERCVHLPALNTLIDLAKVLDLDIAEIVQVAGVGRALPEERVRREAEIALAVQSLSDAALAIAVQQISALERVK